MRVFLFSGHMIDAATRKTARFPPEAEPAAAREIDALLGKLKVRAGDVGIAQGSCGGDLIFAEAMLSRGASLLLHLPFHEQKFRKLSVTYAKRQPPADRWRKRFFDVLAHPRVVVQAMPDATVRVPRNSDPFERCNRWMLRDAFALGGERVCSIFLWNGEKGDGRGGTEHMMRSVREAGGKTCWINTNKLLEGDQEPDR